MPREAQDVTEAELAVMRRLWEAGRASIRQLADALYGEDAGAAQYATVQKQLERLEAKGFVARDRRSHRLVCHRHRRDELIGRRIRAMAEKLCGGSLVPILSHLARTEGLTPKERKALRELIDAPGGKPPRENEPDGPTGGRGRRAKG